MDVNPATKGINRRLDGRNGEIWRAWVSGRTQEFIADKFGISQQRVNQIIALVREGIPEDAKKDWRLVALETLGHFHAEMVEIADSPPPPAFQGGEILKDENGAIVRDVSVRFQALDRVIKLQERAARMLGTDSPVAMEVGGELKVTVEAVDLDQLK